MVYNPDTAIPKQRINAYVLPTLTSSQLDTIQNLFGKGSFSQSPNCPYELFITARPDFANLSYADMRRAVGGEDPFLVIDDKTPEYGGVWYVDNFAGEDEVEEEEAESTDVVWRIRARLEDICIMHANYSIGNMSIGEDLDSVDVELPITEDFTQSKLYTSGLDPETDKFIAPTWVTVEPSEYETTTDPDILKTMSRPMEIMYRLKPEIAKECGLKPVWTAGGRARDIVGEDGTKRSFEEGSVVLQMDYDVEGHGWGGYKRPEGSL